MFDVEKLKTEINKKNISVQELAATLNIDRSSLYRKLKDGSFKIAEANSIIDLLDLPNDKAIAIFFGREVS